MKIKLIVFYSFYVKNLLDNVNPKGFYYIGKRIIVWIYE